MNPNSVNNFFGIKVSKPGINVANASDTQLVYKNDYSTTTYYDESNARVLEGLLPDGSYGMWVSTPGQDVTTANPAAPNQLVFNSNQQTFKVIQSGQGNISGATIGNNTTYYNFTVIPHNLGYVPVFEVFVNVQMLIGNSNMGFNTLDSYTQLPLNFGQTSFPSASPPFTGAISEWDLYAAADTSNLYLQYIIETASSGGAGTLSQTPYYYYLIQPTFS